MKRRTFLLLAPLLATVRPVLAALADAKLLPALAEDLALAGGAIAGKFKGNPGEEFAYQVAVDASRLSVLLRIVRVSELFVAMVRYDIDLLIRANEEADLEKSLSYVRTAHDDIRPKLDYLDQPLPASDDFDGQIPVVVDTQQKGNPVNGLIIRFYMRGLPDDPMPIGVFNKPTTPTSAKVPPGRYIAHVLSASQKLRQTQEVAIGGKGEEVTVVIEIP